MAGCLYYVPDNVSIEDFATRGLNLSAQVHQNGPDGNGGQLRADKRLVSPAELRVKLDEQRWEQVPGKPYWIGCWTNDRAPKPEQLQWPNALRGHAVTLDDGQAWTIPVARAFEEIDGGLVGVCSLPQRSKLNDKGKWESGPVNSRYQRLWDNACQFFDAMTNAAPQASDDESATYALDFAPLHDSATEAIAANYNLTPAEISFLGLLSVQAALRVMQAVVDWPTFQEWSKKKLAEEPAG